MMAFLCFLSFLGFCLTILLLLLILFQAILMGFYEIWSISASIPYLCLAEWLFGAAQRQPEPGLPS